MNIPLVSQMQAANHRMTCLRLRLYGAVYTVYPVTLICAPIPHLLLVTEGLFPDADWRKPLVKHPRSRAVASKAASSFRIVWSPGRCDDWCIAEDTLTCKQFGLVPASGGQARRMKFERRLIKLSARCR